MRLKPPDFKTKTKTTAVFYLRILILLVFIFLCHGQMRAHAATPSCRHVGASSKHATIGSQVDGDIVTICLDASFKKKLLEAVKPKPKAKPAPKRIVTKAPAPQPKPLATKAPAPRSKRIAPRHPVQPKPVPKKPAVKPTPRVTRKALADRAVFKPHTSPITVAPGSALKPGQTARFSTVPKTVLGNSKLLGRPVLVRFTPVSLKWLFGDGASAVSALGDPSARHAYAQKGVYSATVATTFRVAYRLASGRWLSDPDAITLASSPLRLTVGDVAAGEASRVVLLTTP